MIEVRYFGMPSSAISAASSESASSLSVPTHHDEGFTANLARV